MTDIERAARAAYVRTQGPATDEDWEKVWAWHTDPYTTSRGGPWYLLQCVTASLESVLLEPSEEGIDKAVVANCNFGRSPLTQCTYPECGACAIEARGAMRAALHAYGLAILGREGSAS